MSDKKISDRSKTSGSPREMGTTLRDYYDLLLPEEVARIKYRHPSILGALESQHGLIDDMCREAGRFFAAGREDDEACQRLAEYLDNLATAIATVIAPMLYFSSKPGSERKITDIFIARFTSRLAARMNAHIHAGEDRRDRLHKAKRK